MSHQVAVQNQMHQQRQRALVLLASRVIEDAQRQAEAAGPLPAVVVDFVEAVKADIEMLEASIQSDLDADQAAVHIDYAMRLAVWAMTWSTIFCIVVAIYGPRYAAGSLALGALQIGPPSPPTPQ